MQVYLSENLEIQACISIRSHDSLEIEGQKGNTVLYYVNLEGQFPIM